MPFCWKERQKDLGRLTPPPFTAMSFLIAIGQWEQLTLGVSFLLLIGLVIFLFLRNRKLVHAQSSLQKEKEKALDRQAEMIEKTQQENALLLQEVHHRVKNNLQIVTSLLNLQSIHIQDIRIKDAIQTSQHRIKSMALLHQQLYQQENLVAIEMKNYFEELGKSVLHMHGISSRDCHIACDMPLTELHIDTAVPLGLIVNEWLVQVIKHHDLPAESGHIQIQLVRTPSRRFSLRITDNGREAAKSMNMPMWDPLSSQLIDLLRQQLDANMILDPTQANLLKFCFPDPGANHSD